MARVDNTTKLFLHAEQTNRNFVDRVDELTQRRAVIEDIQVRPQTQVYTEKTVASDTFILSSPTFIHPNSYLDGTNVLWDGSTYATETISQIQNLNNTFLELLDHEDFIASNTGTISNSELTLGFQETLTSELIYKGDVSNTVLIDVVGTNKSLLKYEISEDGVTWTEVSRAQTTAIDDWSTIYYRITNNAGGGGALPLDLPGTLTVTDDSVIDRIKIAYGN